MQDCSYSSKGPVSIEIPIDIQRKKIKRPALLDTISLPHINGELGDTKSLDKIENYIKSSKFGTIKSAKNFLPAYILSCMCFMTP